MMVVSGAMPHPWIEAILCCPDCGAGLIQQPRGWRCTVCSWASHDPRDLQPVSPRELTLTHCRQPPADPGQLLEAIPTEPPPLTYTGPAALRDSSAFLSELKQRLQPGATVLDLGCGPRDQQRPIESLGFRYLGVDVDSRVADLLVDAHCLPFQDQSFDAVLSYAVLEHLRDPFLALREITRVLRPGGLYLGTVSQGEPFHASYFHHTAWGLLALFSSQPELDTLRLWAAIDTLESLSRMGRYPKVIRKALAGLHRLQVAVPQLAPRKVRWPRKALQIDALYRAGSIAFVVRKIVAGRELTH